MEYKIISDAPVSFVICISFLALIIGYFFKWFYKEQNKSCHKETITCTKETSHSVTQITFHFYGDLRVPIVISNSNVYRWYHIKLVSQNKEQNVLKSDFVILFICFDNPIPITTFLVNSPDIKLPLYEVKEFNNRFAIICFNENIPAGTITLSVANAK